MALYKACNLPWIEPYINSYAGNSTVSSGTFLRRCCLSPGQCPDTFDGICPYGNLDCRIGNSKYVCKFSDMSVNSTTCYSEGYLATIRSKPCCPPMMGDFLKSRTCLAGTGSTYDSTVCCPKGAGSCEFVLGCLGFQSFAGNLGRKWGVYTGAIIGSPSGTSDCVHEVALGGEKTSNCYAVNGSSCDLGPPPPPPVTATTTTLLPTSPATSTPSGSSSVTGPGAVTPTNKGSEGVSLVGRGRTTVKKAALVLFVPMILQLVLT